MTPIPDLRVCPVNDAPVHADRDHVLYWMIAQRRTGWNFALQHAAHRARQLGKPLLVLEALRVDYPWSSDRLHRFVIDGMAANREACAARGVRYHPYLEPANGEGRGLLAAMAARACLVVTDEFPCFFLPRMVAAAGRALDVRLEQVDGNGLLPLRAAERPFPTAHSFRRFLQRQLPDHLAERPVQDPLASLDLPPATIPRAVLDRWPAVGVEMLRDRHGSRLEELPVDHSVDPVEHGGSTAARTRLTKFLRQVEGYAEDRNRPEDQATSGLSPFLHFGHISAHEIVAAIMDREGWTADRLAPSASGAREGWWGMSASAEAFLDQLVTWRELGYVFGHHHPDDYDSFESLPDWARKTLRKHARDRREHCYDLEQFERSLTHDELWNAAQRQLVREGRIHNYLRMLWGKKVLEWSPDPQAALDVMIELNNKYALDGRNPNSYSGIFWTLGRFDRAWGPERPVFGTVRYMSSANTARKMPVRGYLAEYGAERLPFEGG